MHTEEEPERPKPHSTIKFLQARFDLGRHGRDLSSLQWSAARWQNINVTIPLLLPAGVILASDKTSANAYIFPEDAISELFLFSPAGGLCDVWASRLRLRIAVIQKCPIVFVDRVARIFNQCLGSVSASGPLRLKSRGVYRHNVHGRYGTEAFRYDTELTCATEEDELLLARIRSALRDVQLEINSTIREETRALRECIRLLGATSTDAEPAEVDFRFSPSQKMKVVLREGTSPCVWDADEAIVGGSGETSPFAEQFHVDGILGTEVRLEKERGGALEHDPLFECRLKAFSTVKAQGHDVRAVFWPATSGLVPKIDKWSRQDVLTAGRAIFGGTYQRFRQVMRKEVNLQPVVAPPLDLAFLTSVLKMLDVSEELLDPKLEITTHLPEEFPDEAAFSFV